MLKFLLSIHHAQGTGLPAWDTVRNQSTGQDSVYIRLVVTGYMYTTNEIMQKDSKEIYKIFQRVQAIGRR